MGDSGYVGFETTVMTERIVACGRGHEIDPLSSHAFDGFDDIAGSESDVLDAGSVVELQILLDG